MNFEVPDMQYTLIITIDIADSDIISDRQYKYNYDILNLGSKIKGWTRRSTKKEKRWQ